MNVLYAIWASSVAGAILFFVAGALAARASGAPARTPQPEPEGPPAPPGEGNPTLRTRSLELIAREIGRKEGIRAAAFADELGLPIAGFGDQQEGLAAFCGLSLEVATKVARILPIGTVRRITLETEHATLTACAHGGDTITLATLSHGTGLSLDPLTRALDEAAGTIRRDREEPYEDTRGDQP